VEDLPERFFEEECLERLRNIMIVTRDERMAAAANAAMTTPTMAPVLRPDFLPCGNTGKIA
jgi:hypothetical protein